MDRFSPVTSAQIRVLVLPVGQIERDSFLHLLRRLKSEAAVIRLSDVVGDDERVLFSSKPFPDGSLLLDFTPSASPDHHQQLSPFELFREPLLVIGIADGVSKDANQREEQLGAAAEHLRELHPRVVHRQLLVLQHTDDAPWIDSGNALGVARPSEDNHPALRQCVHKLSARLLRELATFTKALQASPSIQTPGQTSRSLQRTISLRTEERGSGSGRNTPTQVDPSTPTGDDSPSRPPSRHISSPPPATSFDQIPSANGVPQVEVKATSKSRPGARTSSQDRVSTHGFGASTSAEKARTRGKARVGIAIGHVHMMAGQWVEALRMLVEHTTKARSLSDSLWHAKGLEGIMSCLLLFAWAGLEFSIPPICSPERTSSAHGQRFSINLPTDSRLKPAEAARQALLQRLSASLPDLSKLIMGLYRAGEGSLELPALAICEATIRQAKMLAILHITNGELDSTALAQVVLGTAAPRSAHTSAAGGVKVVPKSTIADMLSSAQPTPDDNVPLADHISILAGIASVYAHLRMDRKKAMVIKDIVVRLTGALIQARKLGAAEMGIHPAASLSNDTGAGTILAVVDERDGISNMISDLAQIYGVKLVPDSDRPIDEDWACAYRNLLSGSSFGGAALKFEIMRELVAFCEASPDPFGVLRLTASLLMSARPLSAVDEQAEGGSRLVPREEQLRLATIINRSIGVSRHLGLPDIQAVYWDPFLVRGIDFQHPEARQLIIQRSAVSRADEPLAANPLLYDPNASRPGTAAHQTVVLVANEVANCIVTLQNPLDIIVEVESLAFITEGVELKSVPRPFTLGPSRMQQVQISVSPCSVGALKVTACRIKISECREQVFPIFNKPWSASTPLFVKHIGQEARAPSDSVAPDSSGAEPEPATLTAIVVAEQPSLVVSSISLFESSLMLLDGEVQLFDVILRNVSAVAATVFEATGTPDVLRLAENLSAAGDHSTIADIEAGASWSCRVEITGRAGVSEAKASFLYGAKYPITGDRATATYARCVQVPIAMTVNAALRAQHAEVTPTGSHDAFVLAFDLGNAWPKPLSFRCTIHGDTNSVPGDDALAEQEGLLSPGGVARLSLRIAYQQAFLNCNNIEELQLEVWKHVHLSWRGDGRTGTVNLAGLMLPPEALEAARGSPVRLALRLLDDDDAGDGPKVSASIGSFLTCRGKLENRTTERSAPLFVQLQLRALGAPTLHDDRHVATAGSLCRLIPPLASAESTDVDFTLCPLVAGVLEVVATARPAALSGSENKGGRWQAEHSLTILVA